MRSAYGMSFDAEGSPIVSRTASDTSVPEHGSPLPPAALPAKHFERKESVPKKTDSFIDDLLKNLAEQAPLEDREAESYAYGGLSNLWDDEPKTRDSIVNSKTRTRRHDAPQSDSYIDSLLDNLMDQQQDPVEKEGDHFPPQSDSMEDGPATSAPTPTRIRGGDNYVDGLLNNLVEAEEKRSDHFLDDLLKHLSELEEHAAVPTPSWVSSPPSSPSPQPQPPPPTNSFFDNMLRDLAEQQHDASASEAPQPSPVQPPPPSNGYLDNMLAELAEQQRQADAAAAAAAAAAKQAPQQPPPSNNIFDDMLRSLAAREAHPSPQPSPQLRAASTAPAASTPSPAPPAQDAVATPPAPTTPARPQEPQVSCTAALKAARVALKLGLLERAEGLFELALPDFPSVQADVQHVQQLRREVAKAEELLESGDGERAMACVAGALAASPKGLFIKLLRVRILLRCRRFDEAEKACQGVRQALAATRNGKAVDGKAVEANLRLLAGKALCGVGDLEGAARELERLVEMEPDGAEAAEELALVRAMAAAKEAANQQMAAGEWEAALGSYEQALSINRGADGFNATLHSNRAAALVRLSRFSQAIAAASAALDLKPDYAKALLHRARASMALGDAREATLDLERAIQANPRLGPQLVGELEGARRAAAQKKDDHYALLGVEETATAAHVKKAFHRLALKYHPDKQGEQGPEARGRAERHFQRLTDAQAVLSDPAKRREYDRQRKLGAQYAIFAR